MSVITRITNRFFPPHLPIPAGLYVYNSPQNAKIPYKLQLRVEPDARGLLILNGSTVLHLNQTATEYIYHLTAKTDPDDVARSIAKRYGISRAQAKKDFDTLIRQINALIHKPDLDPVSFLNFDPSDLYSGAISAPYRLDCALTYRVPDEGDTVYAPIDRVKFELQQHDWEITLQKAADAGIPHVVFTGGEPTLRMDLVDLITFSSKLGMVTGLITNGLYLTDPIFLQTLLLSGLDHLMLILNPNEEHSWDALSAVMAEDLSVTVHLTVTPDISYSDGVALNRLTQLGVTKISLSASETGLSDQLAQVRQLIAERNLQLVWDLPVPYSNLHPVALELAGDDPAPTGAGMAILYVEPDGDVLYNQGNPEVIGNLYSDPWASIWQKHK